MANSEIIFSVEESPEGGYEAQALGHDIFTQGETMEELREMVRDAVRCHNWIGQKRPGSSGLDGALALRRGGRPATSGTVW